MSECISRPMTPEEIEKYAKLKPPARDTYEGAVKKGRRASYTPEIIGGKAVIPMGLHGEELVIGRNSNV